MKKIVLGIGVILVLALFYFVYFFSFPPQGSLVETGDRPTLREGPYLYENSEYGYRFWVPTDYVVMDQDMADSARVSDELGWRTKEKMEELGMFDVDEHLGIGVMPANQMSPPHLGYFVKEDRDTLKNMTFDEYLDEIPRRINSMFKEKNYATTEENIPSPNVDRAVIFEANYEEEEFPHSHLSRYDLRALVYKGTDMLTVQVFPLPYDDTIYTPKQRESFKEQLTEFVTSIELGM